MWNLDKPEMMVRFRRDPPWRTISAFSPNGRHLCALETWPQPGARLRRGRVPSGEDPDKYIRGRLLLVDTDTGESLFELEGHEGLVRSAQFSADGDRVLTASTDGTARVWDVRTGACVLVLRGGAACVERALFLPGGTKIATASHDGTVRIWDARTGRALRAFDADKRALCYLELSPDGKRLVAWEDNGATAVIFDADTGERVAVMEAVYQVAFSPDGSLAAVVGYLVLRVPVSAGNQRRAWHPPG